MKENDEPACSAFRPMSRRSFVLLGGLFIGALSTVISLISEAWPDGVFLEFEQLVAKVSIWLVVGFFFSWRLWWISKNSSKTQNKKYRLILIILVLLIIIFQVSLGLRLRN